MIRRVLLPGTGIETSCLGFGGASLGSRISPKVGLDALARAHEAGVAWYDLAPAYGAGEAESIFSRFLAGRRERLSILTKVGLAPPRRSPLLRMAYLAGRPLLALAQGLRKRTRHVRVTRNRALEITPALIESSIRQSLSRLATDHVDVLALHDPEPQAVTDEAVMRALQGVIARGQANFVGVAGSLEACLAGAQPGLPYTVFQTATRPGTSDFAEIKSCAGREVTVIGHSVFGVGGAKERLITHLRGDPSARKALSRAGYDAGDIEAQAGALLLDAALAENTAGVILVSMFKARHLADNVARAEGPPRAASLNLLRKLMERV